MFFISATVAGLVRYWINVALVNYYEGGDVVEGDFFHKYMVILHVILLPLYVLITYLVFYKRRFNYAEVGVMTLYTMSFFFLITTFIWLFRFIWPNIDTAYIELPVIALYNVITFINFYREEKAWLIIIKSLITVTLIFVAAGFFEDLAMSFMR